MTTPTPAPAPAVPAELDRLRAENNRLVGELFDAETMLDRLTEENSNLRARIAELEGEAEDITKAYVAESNKRIDAEAALDAAQQDVERLDWLGMRTGQVEEWGPLNPVRVWAVWGTTGQNLRAAIDAARGGQG